MMEIIRKKFPIFKSNPRLAAFSSFSVGFFLFSILVFLLSYSLSSTEVVRADEPKRQEPTSKFILEVHIANTGAIFLQGARVEAVPSKSTILVSTTWNNMVLLWTINTNESYYGKRHFGTDFLDLRGANVAITDIQKGDYISVSGTLDLNSDVPTIKADVVRVPF